MDPGLASTCSQLSCSDTAPTESRAGQLVPANICPCAGLQGHVSHSPGSCMPRLEPGTKRVHSTAWPCQTVGQNAAGGTGHSYQSAVPPRPAAPVCGSGPLPSRPTAPWDWQQCPHQQAGKNRWGPGQPGTMKPILDWDSDPFCPQQPLPRRHLWGEPGGMNRSSQVGNAEQHRQSQGRKGVGAVISLQTVEGGANEHFLPPRGGHGPSTRGHSVAC